MPYNARAALTPNPHLRPLFSQAIDHGQIPPLPPVHTSLVQPQMASKHRSDGRNNVGALKQPYENKIAINCLTQRVETLERRSSPKPRLQEDVLKQVVELLKMEQETLCSGIVTKSLEAIQQQQAVTEQRVAESLRYDVIKF